MSDKTYENGDRFNYILPVDGEQNEHNRRFLDCESRIRFHTEAAAKYGDPWHAVRCEWCGGWHRHYGGTGDTSAPDTESKK